MAVKQVTAISTSIKSTIANDVLTITIFLVWSEEGVVPHVVEMVSKIELHGKPLTITVTSSGADRWVWKTQTSCEGVSSPHTAMLQPSLSGYIHSDSQNILGPQSSEISVPLAIWLSMSSPHWQCTAIRSSGSVNIEVTQSSVTIESSLIRLLSSIMSRMQKL